MKTNPALLIQSLTTMPLRLLALLLASNIVIVTVVAVCTIFAAAIAGPGAATITIAIGLGVGFVLPGVATWWFMRRMDAEANSLLGKRKQTPTPEAL